MKKTLLLRDGEIVNGCHIFFLFAHIAIYQADKYIYTLKTVAAILHKFLYFDSKNTEIGPPVFLQNWYLE